MEILDIGGGFAGNHIGKDFNESLKYTENDPLNCEFIAEPGRYISSRLCFLAVRVIAKKEYGAKNVAIYINDGIYHSFNKVATDGVTLNDKKIFFDKINKLSANENEVTATIYGQTCDGLDSKPFLNNNNRGWG